MSAVGDLSKKTIIELQEMLIREKTLLKNTSFLQKLPDKGAKVKEKAERIEKEIISRNEDLKESTELKRRRSEVEKLEWSMRGLSASGSIKIMDTDASKDTNNIMQVLDSDDEEESFAERENNICEDLKNEEERIIEMLATSQITQTQSKRIIIDSKLFKPQNQNQTRPLYITKLAEVLDHKSQKSRFIPNQVKHGAISNISIVNTIANLSLEGDNKPSPDPSFTSCPSPSPSNTSSKDEFESCSSGGADVKSLKIRNWDEALAPRKNQFKTVQFLSLEQSFDLSKEYQQIVKESEIKRRSERESKIPRITEVIKDAALQGSVFSFRPQREPVIPLEERNEDIQEDNEIEEHDDSYVLTDVESESDESSEGDFEGENAAVKTMRDLSEIIHTSLALPDL